MDGVLIHYRGNFSPLTSKTARFPCCHGKCEPSSGLLSSRRVYLLSGRTECKGQASWDLTFSYSSAVGKDFSLLYWEFQKREKRIWAGWWSQGSEKRLAGLSAFHVTPFLVYHGCTSHLYSDLWPKSHKLGLDD